MTDVVGFADRGAEDEATRPRWMVDWAGLIGGGLIAVGIVLELVYMFNGNGPYWNGAQELSYLLRNALDTGALAVSAVLVVAGSWPTAAPAWPDSRSRRRVRGGLLGAGLCALYLVDSLVTIGYVATGLEHVVSPTLGLTWWLPVAVGSGLSLVRKGGLASTGRPGRPRRPDALPLALLAITVGGALVTWLPGWVRYTFTGSMGPHSEVLTSGLGAPWVQFGGPWVEKAGSIGEATVIVAMAAAAVLWRPARFGAVFLAGAVLFLVTSGIEGIGDVAEALPRAYFGIPAAARMTISVAGTLWLWAFCGFTALLIVVYGWLFIRSRPRPWLAAVPVTSTESATPGPADPPLLPLSLSELPELERRRDERCRGCPG